LAAERRILAIDYGSVRVGLALSDPMGIIASGYGTLANDASLMQRLRGITEEQHVVRIVIGMPLTLRGERGEAAAMVDKFVEQLREALAIDVVTLDERFTSSIAERTIREMGVGKKKRRDKGKVDELAAAVLLQDYLNSGAHLRPVRGG
jgi:putative Holliday junction resolvase